MVRRDRRENGDRKETQDTQMRFVFRKAITKMLGSCSRVRSLVQKGRVMILAARHIIFSCLSAASFLSHPLNIVLIPNSHS